jgi:uncharacterized protein YkwD
LRGVAGLKGVVDSPKKRPDGGARAVIGSVRRAGRLLTLAPFIIVGALALGVAVAGYLSTPPIVGAPSPSIVPTAAVVVSPSPTATAASPSPEPTAIPTATPRASDAAEMLRVHNELRAAIGAPPVRADERVTAAARAHAEYLARNRAGGHDETPGQPGFTGTQVLERLTAQGYNATTASEVATSFSTGTDGVRSLWVLPYHRLGLMHPHAVVAGWGHADVDGRTATVGVLVYDFGADAPERVRSPALDQRVPASWSGEEIPDVLPPGAARPVGYPVMALYSKARTVDLRSARVTDPSGREIAHHVVPQIYERDYVAIVPASPLTPGMRYRVRLELRVAGVDVVEDWEFETER